MEDDVVLHVSPQDIIFDEYDPRTNPYDPPLDWEKETRERSGRRARLPYQPPIQFNIPLDLPPTGVEHRQDRVPEPVVTRASVHDRLGRASPVHCRLGSKYNRFKR